MYVSLSVSLSLSISLSLSLSPLPYPIPLLYQGESHPQSSLFLPPFPLNASPHSPPKNLPDMKIYHFPRYWHPLQDMGDLKDMCHVKNIQETLHNKLLRNTIRVWCIMAVGLYMKELHGFPISGLNAPQILIYFHQEDETRFHIVPNPSAVYGRNQVLKD